jgi:hypothetical protein
MLTVTMVLLLSSLQPAAPAPAGPITSGMDMFRREFTWISPDAGRVVFRGQAYCFVGERLTTNPWTCSHPWLPAGTRLVVTWRNRNALVVVDERAPFALSSGACAALGIGERGRQRVRARVVKI